MVQRLSHSTRSPTRQLMCQTDRGCVAYDQISSSSASDSARSKPLDPGHAPASEIQHAPAAFGMGANQRMQRAGCLARIVGRSDALPDIAAAVVGAVVLDPQPQRPLTQRGGQALERRVHVAEPCVAAGGRNFQRVEHARLGRMRADRTCRCARPPPRCRGCRSPRHFRSRSKRHRFPACHWRCAGHFPESALIQLAEPARERDQIRVRNALIAKHEHLMIDPRLVDGGEAGIVKPPQVNVVTSAPNECPA